VIRVARAAGLTLGIPLLVSCGSCPAPEVELGDRVRVVIGPAENPDDVPCDAVGFGVGAEFIGEIAETHTLGSVDSGPWASGCVPPLFTGPISVVSDWTFEPIASLGATIWGGGFTVKRGDACTGRVRLDVYSAEEDFLTVSFSPEAGTSCPEQCSSRHAAVVEVIGGSGGAGSGGASGGTANDGSLSSGGAESSASGGETGAGVGGVSASGGAATGGTGGGAPVLDAALDQRIQASCDAECADYAEVQGCYPQGTSQEDCRSRCYSAVRTKYFALCPDEYLAVLECTEEHPGAQAYACEGTELVVADTSCDLLAVAMRDCWEERQGS
jgi:hypothetical protein